MKTFWGRFLRYRFDFAALAFDCVATFFRQVGPIGRLLALSAALLLVLPPVFVLLVGNDKFGNGWAFGLTLVIFVVLIEWPGHGWRRGTANGSPLPDGDSYDLFLLIVFTIVGGAAPILLFGVDIHSDVLLGITWGVALVGAQDVARSGIALSLALAHGRPVYSTDDSY